MLRLGSFRIASSHDSPQLCRLAATNHVKSRQFWEVTSRSGMQRNAPIRVPNVAHRGGQAGQLANRLKLVLSDRVHWSLGEAIKLTNELISIESEQLFAENVDLVSNVCFHLFELGHSSSGISLGKNIADKAEFYGNIPAQRRICNVVGAQYGDIADFAAAMKYLERAVVLARLIGDPFVEAACLANVVAVLQEMGHYRQAISMAQKVLKLDDVSENAQALKIQCASNGLFAAHRVGDNDSASRFLAQGQECLSGKTPALRRAFFERARVLYLVDRGQVGLAKVHVDATVSAIGVEQSPRIQTLLTIATSVCNWGLSEVAVARADLARLHSESKESRLYHHFVLQALIKTYSNATNPADALVGLSHARELVEFTTSVKKAKFYKQLASRREEVDQRHTTFLTNTTIDPFHSVKDWLSSSEVLGPEGEGERRTLTKHEELTAIHDDMANLRVASLRREIRTDAVDTAENWAIAAEFFDDETGQHCYRVGHLASMLAREIGLDDTFCVRVEHAARLHDIGKIAVNEVILLKPGPLDASEMAAMRLHTEVGAQILSGSDDPTLMMAVEVARHHHEWWNGSGYPTKASGRDIPISARVCAYADVYDALTHARSYKKAWTHERALGEIVRLAGTQFDPDLIAPFCAVVDRYRVELDSARAIPAFADMDSNALIASRKKLMETIASGSH